MPEFRVTTEDRTEKLLLTPQVLEVVGTGNMVKLVEHSLRRTGASCSYCSSWLVDDVRDNRPVPLICKEEVEKDTENLCDFVG